METKCNSLKINKIRRFLKFDNCFIVDSLGFSGGLAMLRASDLDINVHSYSNQHISAIVHRLEGNIDCRFTGFFGHP